MNEPNTLLPSNATGFEVDLELAAARLAQVPVPIADLWDADALPSELLPWLAWAFSIDYWEWEWSDQKKRNALRLFFDVHRQKGTLAGIRQIIRFANGKLTEHRVPPDKAFCAPKWDDATRQEWLRKFPELRVYRFRDRGAQGHTAMPANGANGVAAKVYLGGRYHYPALSDATKRVAPRVYRVTPDGEQTELTSLAYTRTTVSRNVVERIPSQPRRGSVPVEEGGETTYRIVGPALRGRGAMLGDPSADTGALFLGGYRAYAADKRAHRRTYFTEFQSNFLENVEKVARYTVQPLLDRGTRGVDLRVNKGDPLTARADLVAERGVRQGAMLGSVFPGHRAGVPGATNFLVNTFAGDRFYTRSRLFDPAVSAPTRGQTQHLGAMRLGMPPYHAELRVRLQGKRHRRRAWRFVNGYLMEADHSDRAKMLKALRWSVSKRDKVMVTTTTARPVTAGGSVIAGPHLIAGSWTGVRA